MAFPDWREPVQLLREQEGPPSARQRTAAEALGVRWQEDEPRSILAARVREAVDALFRPEPRPEPTPRQLAYLERLGGGRRANADRHSWHGVHAWIQHLLTTQTISSLEEFEFCQGDLIEYRWPRPRVLTSDQGGDDGPLLLTGVVSSISGNGRVNLCLDRVARTRVVLRDGDEHPRAIWPARVVSVVHGTRWHALSTGTRVSR